MSSISKDNTLLFICDVQGVFKSHLFLWDEMITGITTLSKGINILGCSIVVSEQVPEKLGSTVHELQFLFDKEKTSVDVYKYSKTLFSMITPDVENYIRSKAIPIKNTQTCITQTCLSLLDMNIQPYIIVDATSSINEYERRIAINRLLNSKVVVTTVESVLFQLLKDASCPNFLAIKIGNDKLIHILIFWINNLINWLQLSLNKLNFLSVSFLKMMNPEAEEFINRRMVGKKPQSYFNNSIYFEKFLESQNNVSSTIKIPKYKKKKLIFDPLKHNKSKIIGQKPQYIFLRDFHVATTIDLKTQEAKGRSGFFSAREEPTYKKEQNKKEKIFRTKIHLEDRISFEQRILREKVDPSMASIIPEYKPPSNPKPFITTVEDTCNKAGNFNVLLEESRKSINKGYEYKKPIESFAHDDQLPNIVVLRHFLRNDLTLTGEKFECLDTSERAKKEQEQFKPLEVNPLLTEREDFIFLPKPPNEDLKRKKFIRGIANF